MDLLPCSGESEMVCHESFLSKDFERSISFFSQLLTGLCCGDIGSFQPNSVSFLVVMSVCLLLVVKCLHHLGGLCQCSLCFSSGFCEVVSKVLGHLAFDFVTGFESFVRVSSMIEEER